MSSDFHNGVDFFPTSKNNTPLEKLEGVLYNKNYTQYFFISNFDKECNPKNTAAANHVGFDYLHTCIICTAMPYIEFGWGDSPLPYFCPPMSLKNCFPLSTRLG